MFVKFRFKNEKGATAGLIVSVEQYRDSSISELSRMFPMSEARFMTGVIQVSDKYDTFEEAFAHDFDADSVT